MIKSILFPTDLSDSALKGFNWVAEIAAWHDSALHVLHVIPSTPLYEPADVGIDDFTSTREDAFFEMLEKRVPERLKATGSFRYSVGVAYSVTEEIIRYVDEHDIELIAMGTHGHRSLLHPSLGGTTGGVLRQAGCPVLTWHVNDKETREYLDPPRHILAPIDFSSYSEKTLKVAKNWAEHYRAKLSVLFVAEQRIVPIFNDTLIPSVHVVEIDKDQRRRAGEALTQLLDSDPSPGIEIETRVRSGHAASEILRFVDEQQVDLVVMSSHGLRGSSLFSMGSTSEQVVRKAGCAVLTDKVTMNAE